MKWTWHVLATPALLSLLLSNILGAVRPGTQNADLDGMIVSAPTPIAATVETDPVPHGGDAADDPAIWVNAANPAQSTIIGTDKQGGLAVYGLDGMQIQYLPDGKLNNVDIRSGFPLGGQRVVLVTAGNRTNDTLAIYRVNAATRQLERVAARTITTLTVYGSCMYHSPTTSKFYYFVNSKAGAVEQWELFDNGAGKVDAARVRAFDVGSQTEGCVADDQLGHFYIGEESTGIWKYGAEPNAGSTRTQVDTTGSGGHLTADVEGLTIAYGANGSGSLIASSQGNNTFVVYERGGTNAYVTTFQIVAGNGIDAVSDTDGIDVTTANLGPAFPQGLFVAQDGSNDSGNQNFKLVPLHHILGSAPPPSTTPPPATTATPKPTIATPRPTTTATPQPTTATPQPTQPPPAPGTIAVAADTSVCGGDGKDTSFGRERVLEVKDGGDPGFDRLTYLKFDLRSAGVATVKHATLRILIQNLPNGASAPLQVWSTRDTWDEAITWSKRPALDRRLATTSIRNVGWLRLDVTSAVNQELKGDQIVSLVLQDTATARRMVRIASRESGTGPVLIIDGGGASGPAPSATPARPSPTAPSSPTAPTPAPTTTLPPQTPAPPSPTSPPSSSGSGIWISRAELARRPTAGVAWNALVAAASSLEPAAADIANQDSDHDVKTLAAGLVYARTGDTSYRIKAANALMAAIGTERGGRTLALGRNLVAYVIAADLIDLRGYNAALDQHFRAWLSAVRTEELGGKTLISTHEDRPNNWGTHAGAARVAAARYLGDNADLARAAQVFKGWLGDRSAYAGFTYGDLSWQADPAKPVGVNPLGTVKLGHPIDGALPDDMRRGCSVRWPPCQTGYAWEAMQGAVVQAELLSRAGYDVWNWQNQALLRATQFLYNLNQEVGGWWATGDDTWQPWVINKAYGSSFPAISPVSAGKNMGWTDWTHAR